MVTPSRGPALRLVGRLVLHLGADRHALAGGLRRGRLPGRAVGGRRPATAHQILFSLIVMAVFTGSSAGLQMLRFTVNIGIACELVASVGVGIVLMLGFRHQPFHALVDTCRSRPTPFFRRSSRLWRWLAGFCSASTRAARWLRRPATPASRCRGRSCFDRLGRDRRPHRGRGLMLSTPDLGDVSAATSPTPSPTRCHAFGGWALPALPGDRRHLVHHLRDRRPGGDRARRLLLFARRHAALLTGVAQSLRAQPHPSMRSSLWECFHRWPSRTPTCCQYLSAWPPAATTWAFVSVIGLLYARRGDAGARSDLAV